MKPDILYGLRFLQHYFLSRSKFDLHSPFVYKLYADVLKDKTGYSEYLEIPDKTGDKISHLSTKDYKLLFRLSRYFKPRNILIMATTGEIEASYLASGFHESRIIIINDPGMITDSGVFDMVFVLCDQSRNLIQDYFYRTMQHTHNDSVRIYYNINGSMESRNMWKEIKNHPSVTLTIDLFQMGLVFINNNLSKEDYKLRF